ncbi:hypothetical protein [Streptomyces sp. NPDC088739]|uniref:hypothetical protein n=1 Tax=Streptomyces sp. NPDC088739 TaxID=3365882 RepID=UPI00382EB019
MVGFGGVPMLAHCPDPYALALVDDLGSNVEDSKAARQQIRQFLAHILGTAEADQVEQMMCDPANRDVTLVSVRGLIDWLMRGDDGPHWEDAMREEVEAMGAGAPNRAQRRVAVKKTAAKKTATAARRTK